MSKHEWQMITSDTPPDISQFKYPIKLWRNKENWYVFEYDEEQSVWTKCTEKRLITIMGNDYKYFAPRVDFESDKPTLRDQFAISAMSALIIGTSNRKCETDDGEYFDYFYEVAMNDHGRSDYSQITEQAYEIADAMMEARK